MDDLVKDHIARPQLAMNGYSSRSAVAGAPRLDPSILGDALVFETLAWRNTRVFVEAPYVYFGGADGSFIGVQQLEDGAVRVGVKAADEALRHYYLGKFAGDRSQPAGADPGPYDPRQRPWYTAAVDAKGRAWSRVYPSFSRNELLVTLAEPQIAADGAVRGVVGIDLSLKRLSAALLTLTISPNSVMYIVDRERHVVAGASAEPLFSRDAAGNTVRLSLGATDRPLGRALAPRLSELGEQPRTLSIDGEPIVGLNLRLSGEQGPGWSLLIAAPEADFVETVRKQALMTAALIAAALASFLIVGVLMLRWFFKDLDLLTGLAHAIGRDAVPCAAPSTRIREFSRLGSSFHATADSLVHSRRLVVAQNARLEEANATLEERVAARTGELEISREAALEAARAKETFLSTMSHEIRTPMNGVIGMTGLLAETPLSADQRDYVDTIKVSGEQLLAIINDILDFSRIESGKMALESEPLTLWRLIEDAFEMVAAKARERDVELLYAIDHDVPATIFGDVTRLRQILINLTGNAVKFTERGEVFVSVHLAQAAPQGEPVWIEFRVRDSGIGIPPERLGALFQAFVQVDASTSRKYGGTGLGLAICKRLTEMMGGSIGVTSTAGQGSTFHFTLCARAAPALAEHVFEFDHAAMASRRLLLVDDKPTNLRILSRQLEQWGIASTTALSGPEALRALDHVRFDLAILDMQMPDMDGVALARAIRAHPTAAGLPLVLFSSDPAHRAADADGLFRATLSKPIRQSQMFDAIASILVEDSFRRPRHGEAAPAVKLAHSMPLRLLVADDNAVNRKVARLVIKRSGYEIDTAETGTEAVEMSARAIAAGTPYDIVFMDVQMPSMDGYDATRALIAAHGPARPFVVAMTANAMQGDREACIAAGMDDYLTKPLDFRAVEKALSLWGARRARPGAEAPAIDDTSAPAAGRAAHPLESAASTHHVSARDAASAEWADAKILDESRLAEMAEYDDDGSLIAGMIKSYLADMPARIAAMQAAHDADDAGALALAAHALKGSASNIGARRLSAICKRIEAAGSAGRVVDATFAVTLLIDSARSSQGALETYLARGGSAPS